MSRLVRTLSERGVDVLSRVAGFPRVPFGHQNGAEPAKMGEVKGTIAINEIERGAHVH